jgi:hypothetical protein
VVGGEVGMRQPDLDRRQLLRVGHFGER